MRKKQFSADINHSITKAEFNDFITNYRNRNGAETSVFFDKQAIQSIIDQKDAEGCRYYYAEGDDVPTLVLAGTNAKGQDLLKGESVKVSIPDPPLTGDGRYNPHAANHSIELTQAAKLTSNYRNQMRAGQKKGGFFGKRIIHEILQQANCIGIRFWFGAKKDGTRVIALAGVDAAGQNLLEGKLAELSMLCPPICGDENLLNSGAAGRLACSNAAADNYTAMKMAA